MSDKLEFSTNLSDLNSILIPGWARPLLSKISGQRIVVTIKKWHKPRNLSLNAYYWLTLNQYLLPIFQANCQAWTDEDVHEQLCLELGYYDLLVTPDGEVRKRRLLTRFFDQKKFSEYYERYTWHVLELYHIDIPEPVKNYTQSNKKGVKS